MVIVRDYYDIQDRWISWQSANLQSAYVDYPYSGIAGYPDVSELAGRVFVMRSIRTDSGVSGISPSTVWVVDGDDIYPEFNLAGHTGEWGILIHEPAPDETQVYGLVSEGDDLVASPDSQASVLTVNSLDVYPHDSGLPDSVWLRIGPDLVLNTPA